MQCIVEIFEKSTAVPSFQNHIYDVIYFQQTGNNSKALFLTLTEVIYLKADGDTYKSERITNCSFDRVITCTLLLQSRRYLFISRIIFPPYIEDLFRPGLRSKLLFAFRKKTNKKQKTVEQFKSYGWQKDSNKQERIKLTKRRNRIKQF